MCNKEQTFTLKFDQSLITGIESRLEKNHKLVKCSTLVRVFKGLAMIIIDRTERAGSKRESKQR